MKDVNILRTISAVNESLEQLKRFKSELERYGFDIRKSLTEYDLIKLFESGNSNERVTYVCIPDLENKNNEAFHDAIQYFDKRCPYCKNEFYSGSIRDKIEKDHFYPIKKGGQDVPWNILPSCKKCNVKKKDQIPFDYLDQDTFEVCHEYLLEVKKKLTDSISMTIERSLIVERLIDEYKINQSIPNDINTLISKIFEIYGVETVRKPNSCSGISQRALKQLFNILKRNSFPDSIKVDDSDNTIAISLGFLEEELKNKDPENPILKVGKRTLKKVLYKSYGDSIVDERVIYLPRKKRTGRCLIFPRDSIESIVNKMDKS